MDTHLTEIEEETLHLFCARNYLQVVNLCPILCSLPG